MSRYIYPYQSIPTIFVRDSKSSGVADLYMLDPSFLALIAKIGFITSYDYVLDEQLGDRYEPTSAAESASRNSKRHIDEN